MFSKYINISLYFMKHTNIQKIFIQECPKLVYFFITQNQNHTFTPLAFIIVGDAPEWSTYRTILLQ